MAERAELRVRVTSSRNATTVTIRSVGRYRSLATNEENVILLDQPVFGNATESAFWNAVLPVVQANV